MIPFEHSVELTPNVDVEHALPPTKAMKFKNLAAAVQGFNLDKAERLLGTHMLQNYSVNEILSAFETDGKDVELRRTLALLQGDTERERGQEPAIPFWPFARPK